MCGCRHVILHPQPLLGAFWCLIEMVSTTPWCPVLGPVAPCSCLLCVVYVYLLQCRRQSVPAAGLLQHQLHNGAVPAVRRLSLRLDCLPGVVHPCCFIRRVSVQGRCQDHCHGLPQHTPSLQVACGIEQGCPLLTILRPCCCHKLHSGGGSWAGHCCNLPHFTYSTGSFASLVIV